jgi:Concanavalin A-like lectin/glucanases superfamily
VFIKRSPLWCDPRVKPPFRAVRVNWGHPLAVGLQGCFLLNERAGLAYNLAGARHATDFTNSGRNPWDDQGFLGDGVTVLGSRVPMAPVTQYPVTVACGLTVRAGTDGAAAVELAHTGGDDYISIYYVDTTPQIVYGVGITGGIFASCPALSPFTDREYRLAGVSRSSTQHELWVNGGLRSTASTAVTFPSINTFSLGCSFKNAPAGRAPWRGRLLWAAIWSRGLTPAEIAAVNTEPFTYLMPDTRGGKRVFPDEGLTWLIHSR